MKKLFTIILLFTFMTGYSQTDHGNGVDNTDSINTELINSAGKDLQRFEKQNTLGFVITIAGSLITSFAYSAYSKATTQAEMGRNRGFTVFGVAVTMVGGIITLSSSSNVGAAGRKLRKVKRKK